MPPKPGRNIISIPMIPNTMAQILGGVGFSFKTPAASRAVHTGTLNSIAKTLASEMYAIP